MLDLARACNTVPDQAASFFSLVFHPTPHLRLTSDQPLPTPTCSPTRMQCLKLRHPSQLPSTMQLHQSLLMCLMCPLPAQRLPLC